MNRAVKMTVKGRVQGVGFRWFSKTNAERFNITGYVRNLFDGNVEIYAEGSPDDLNAFIIEIHRGPSFSNITSVDMEDLPATGDYTSFKVTF